MKKIAYLGSKALGLSLLKALHTPNDQWRIIHPNDEADGRSVLGGFQDYAREQALDLTVASGQSAADAMLADFAPDIVFVCGWYWLLKPEVLDSVPMGFWGVHNSLLPKYRGGAPLVWSIINGDAVVGSSAFKFTPGMDDGPILHRVQIDVSDRDHIGGVLARIETGLIDELPAKWRDLLAGNAELEPQDEANATYCGQRSPEDGAIDWRSSAREIQRFIRAQSKPYPGAFTYAGDVKVTVLDAEIDSRLWHGTPGQILERTKDYVLVACGAQWSLRVTSVEVDGTKAAPRDAFRSVAVRLKMVQ